MQHICTFCNKVLGSKQSLQRHLKTCKQATAHLVRSLNEELVQTKQQAQELSEQIKAVPAPQTVIHNHIVNNTNNTYNCTSQTQNNTLMFARETFDRLVPITTDMLDNMVNATFDDAEQNFEFLNDLENLSSIWMQGALKNSVIVTDTSRKIAYWKDGDRNNETIRDKTCDALSLKLQNAIKPETLNQYSAFLQRESVLDRDRQNEYALEIVDSSLLVDSLRQKNSKKLGAALVKFAPSSGTRSIIDQSTKTLAQRFPQLQQLVLSSFQQKIHLIVCNPPDQIGMLWLVRHIIQPQSYLNTDNVVSVRKVQKEDVEELMFVIQNSVTISSVEFLDAVKEILHGMTQLECFALYAAQNTVCNKSAEEIQRHIKNFFRWLEIDRTNTSNNQQTKEFLAQYEEQLLMAVYIQCV